MSKVMKSIIDTTPTNSLKQLARKLKKAAGSYTLYGFELEGETFAEVVKYINQVLEERSN